MPLKTKSKTPRAMPVEAVLTRKKLAQLKQNKAAHKKVKLNAENELLRLRSRKRKISEKIFEVKEYQPDKVKRKIELSKVMLKPKHNHTVIADMTKCNKRKLSVPKKDISEATPIESTPSNSEMSVLELITLMEGSQEMNDDDFLEILTCPSPVWWEEPPPGYTEDPISADYTKKLNDAENKVIEANTKNETIFNIDNLSVSVKKDIKNDSIYINKSKKLEALLGNIKNKKVKKSNSCDSLKTNDLCSLNIDDLEIDVKKSDVCITVCESQNEMISKASNLRDFEENIELPETTQLIRSSPICIELNSDETDPDDLMNVSLDDKTLYLLENMEIPIVHKT